MKNEDDPTRTRDLAAIHAAKRQLGLDDDAYRMLLRSVTGRDSAGELAPAQRAAVLSRMRRGRSTASARSAPNRGGGAAPTGAQPPNPNVSAAQWRYVKDLQAKLGWTDEHLRNYVRHCTMLDHERFLDAGSARNLIAGLRRTLDYKK